MRGSGSWPASRQSRARAPLGRLRYRRVIAFPVSRSHPVLRSLSRLVLAMVFPVGLAALGSSAMAADPRVVHVTKTATCGCCAAWVEHIEKAGFDVVVRDVPNDALDAFKRSVGIAAHQRSCHTALVEDYVIEGHVDARTRLHVSSKSAPMRSASRCRACRSGHRGWTSGRAVSATRRCSSRATGKSTSSRATRSSAARRHFRGASSEGLVRSRLLRAGFPQTRAPVARAPGSGPRWCRHGGACRRARSAAPTGRSA